MCKHFLPRRSTGVGVLGSLRWSHFVTSQLKTSSRNSKASENNCSRKNPTKHAFQRKVHWNWTVQHLPGSELLGAPLIKWPDPELKRLIKLRTRSEFSQSSMVITGGADCRPGDRYRRHRHRHCRYRLCTRSHNEDVRAVPSHAVLYD
ncbi:hypothetical protein J6590_016501 [Homalodisca vitripennis]|nr:hypothetical protein J6590_016501 [Homalodisca vitripennis]